MLITSAPLVAGCPVTAQTAAGRFRRISRPTPTVSNPYVTKVFLLDQIGRVFVQAGWVGSHLDIVRFEDVGVNLHGLLLLITIVAVYSVSICLMCAPWTSISLYNNIPWLSTHRSTSPLIRNSVSSREVRALAREGEPKHTRSTKQHDRNHISRPFRALRGSTLFLHGATDAVWGAVYRKSMMQIMARKPA